MQKTTALSPAFAQPESIRAVFEQAVRPFVGRRQAVQAEAGVTRQELTRLLDVARGLSRCVSASELLDRMFSDLLAWLPCESAAVVLLGEELRVLDVREVGADSWGTEKFVRGMSLPTNLQRIVRTAGQAVHLGGGRMCVVLRGQGGVTGLLLVSADRRRAMQTEILPRIEAFAEVAATAVEALRARDRAAQAAAEHERARLSRDLHDSVSQSLFGVSMGVRTGLEMLTDGDTARQPIAFALDLADAAFTQMRALIFEMRSDCLQEEGILRGLRRQCDAIVARYKSETGADLNIRLSESEPAMSATLREAMYRIAVEAMQNAGKHAHATEISVDLHADDEAITLTIRDDGRGFDPQATYHGHLGLKSMRERAELAGAELHFESAPGCGTAIVVRAGKK